jgi:hypothetical protein
MRNGNCPQVPHRGNLRFPQYPQITGQLPIHIKQRLYQAKQPKGTPVRPAAGKEGCEKESKRRG